MNEISEITTNTPIEIALGVDEYGRFPKEFWEELQKVTDFESFYVCISKMKLKADLWQLYFLEKLVCIFGEKYSWSAIIYLSDEIDLEFVRKQEHRNSGRNEYYYQNELIKKFKDIFPQYKYIGKEIKVPKIGRIDILAIDKKSSRYVIIECKMGKISPVKQLIAYSEKYKNPILISVTEAEISKKNQHSNITYYTYSELGIV